MPAYSEQRTEHKKYNKIVMLVHPLFYLTFEYISKDPESLLHSVSWNRKRYLEDPLDKESRSLFGMFCDNYARTILNAKKDPNAFVVFVEPSFFKQCFDNPGITCKTKLLKDFADLYYGHFAELKKFAKKMLGDRIYFTNYSPHIAFSLPLLPKRLLYNLSAKIDLDASGEYVGGLCVDDWLRYMTIFLEQKGIKVNNKKIDYFRSYGRSEASANCVERCQFLAKSQFLKQKRRTQAKLRA